MLHYTMPKIQIESSTAQTLSMIYPIASRAITKQHFRNVIITIRGKYKKAPSTTNEL